MTPAPGASPARRALAVVRRGTAQFGSLLLALLLALGFMQYYQPRAALARAPFGPESSLLPRAEPAARAFGRSGAVHVRFALPGERVDYPLDLGADPAELAYGWVSLTDTTWVDSVRALGGGQLTAPAEPGFYRLALARGAARRIVDGVTVAVLVPFEAKRGTTLDGYRIGTFLAERLGGHAERPLGFVKVTPEAADVPVTAHLRVGDFLTRDAQTQWPRYAAISPRVLDKIELVVAEVARMRGDTVGAPRVGVSVHSGFRTPLYNRAVPRAARDSRHQYGDAIDVAIDANGDGRLTASDTRLVAMAVERVEAAHPDLAGGMGIYTGRRYRQPYVHIDTRGTKARWRG